MIPKIIHNIWIQGYNSIPNEYIKYIQNNRILFDDYVYIFWDDYKITKLLLYKFPKNYKIYILCNIPAQKSDIARICILYEYGGIYYDVDFIFNKKIDVFLEYDFFGVSDCICGVKKIYNGIIGSIKKNKILLKFINKINKLDEDELNNKYNILLKTGTIAFYNIIKKFLTKDKNIYNIKIINKIYLFPQSTFDNTKNLAHIKNYIFAHASNNSSWSPKIYNNSHKLISNINNLIYESNYNLEELYFLSNKIIQKKNHNNFNNLIVIAHPDDEIIFFGDFLLKNANNTTVLCVTNSSNLIRSIEFVQVMNKVNCNYIMWDLKDCKSYSKCSELKKKLNKIVHNYNNIYTHSLSGETGHPVHILLSMYLYDIVNKNLYVSNLNIFKSELSQEKLKLFKIYKSQLYNSIIFHIYKTSKEDYLKIK